MQKGKLVKEGSRLFVVVQIYNDGISALNKRYYIHPDSLLEESSVGEDIHFEEVYIGNLLYAKPIIK